ncbi:amino acid ABC transporter permease, partial [Thermodesulfobacteriota bacterium]
MKIRISPIDFIIIPGVILGLFYFSYHISVGLNYNWNWSAIPQYLFRYDPARGEWIPNLLMQGLFTTIRLSIWGILLAIFLGIIMGFCRTSNSLFKRLLGSTYVELIRNTPPLVLIFIFYFFFSSQIIPATGLETFIQSLGENSRGLVSFLFSPPSTLAAFLSATLTLGIFEGAYITEIIRSGIQSIEKGQWEASYTLGFSRYQQYRHVIFPQALRRILPPLAGQFI